MLVRLGKEGGSSSAQRAYVLVGVVEQWQSSSCRLPQAAASYQERRSEEEKSREHREGTAQPHAAQGRARSS